MMLLVSIHDVAPPFEAEVRELWTRCRRHGIVPALLLVPRWHGAHPLERAPDLLHWVRARADEGAEIFLHGERHDEVGVPRTLRDHWQAWNRTDGEGEFLTLDARQAGERIGRGLSHLRGLGFAPIGFVPPAWLARPGAFVAARQAGLRVAEDDAGVVALSTLTWTASPVVRWSARTPFRARMSSLVAGARWRLQRGARVMRIALHPQDLRDAGVASSIDRALAAWTAQREPTRYEALVA